MKNFERLYPDDMVMKIPGPSCPGIFLDTEDVPVGTCGTVLEGEGELTYWDHMMVPYVGYGCYVHFPSCPTPNEKGWFINRPRLMKITPNDDLKNEKEEDGKIFEMAKSIAESTKDPLKVD